MLSLLALVVLSILGLGLSLVTQTEMQIGTNERIVQRVFYASDSGINLATARVLVIADHLPRTYTLTEPESPLGATEEVEVSAFYPILDSPCNLCEINDAGTYSQRSYRSITHAVTSVAERDPGGNQRSQGKKTVSAMMEVQLARCVNGPCSNSTLLGARRMLFELAGQFYHHDFSPKRTEPLKGYFNENDQTLDPVADARCLGLDPNTGGPTNITDPFNAETDPFSGYNLRFPTQPDPINRCPAVDWAYSVGDRLPLDWLADHRQTISRRMAPNTLVAPLVAPDFRTTVYFEDLPAAGESFLRLRDLGQRPTIAFARTPLGRAIKNFRQFWQGCAGSGNACATSPSWAKIAAGDVAGCSGDPEWDCRRHFLLVITDLPPLEDGESDPYDGCQAAPIPADQPDSSNPDDPCNNVADLLRPRSTPSNSSIETFVISFGRGLTPAKQLQCMAREGSRDGQGTPFSARNKDELVAQLLEVLDKIREQRTAFASAAVPSVQAEAGDKLFVTQFTPLQGKPRWDGHVFNFLKPIPLTDPPERAPKLCARCDGSGCAVDGRDEDGDGQFDAACLAWDAGEVLLTQAAAAATDPDGSGPLVADNTTVDLQLQHESEGSGLDQRRVLYAMFHGQGTWNRTASSRQLLDRTCGSGNACDASRQSDAVRYDLWRAFDPDLAATWSTPSLGRIRICGTSGGDCAPGGADLEDRYVAIFGGGLTNDQVEQWGESGNWLYILDVETGDALYKRPLLGSVPSEPAAVDSNADGYLDRIYVGTTLGLMYRVDLTAEADGQFPGLQAVFVRDLNGSLHRASRVLSAAWDPRVVFSATPTALPTPIDPADITTPQPLFFRPSVLFVAELDRYALAFGTGDREDLWRTTSAAGRFYVVVDDTSGPGAPPIHEGQLTAIDPGSVATETNLLLNPPAGSRRGWFVRLDVMERVIAEAFSVSGVTIFSSFQPSTGPGQAGGTCARRGTSRLFGVLTTNANGILFESGSRTRFKTEETLVSQPFIEQGQTRNPGDASLTPEELENLEAIMEELKKLFPPSCRFANYRLDIQTVSADTGLVRIAPIPVCIIQKNWKEY
jgi:hypothetical protein